MHIERIWQHDTLYWHTMSRATPRQGYVLFTNPALPQRYDPNHAGYFRLQSDAQAQDAIRDIIAFYDALGFDSVAYVDHCATPTTLAHLLMQHGPFVFILLRYHRVYGNARVVCWWQKAIEHQ